MRGPDRTSTGHQRGRNVWAWVAVGALFDNFEDWTDSLTWWAEWPLYLALCFTAFAIAHHFTRQRLVSVRLGSSAAGQSVEFTTTEVEAERIVSEWSKPA